MYESLSEFLRATSAGNPLLWALLVMTVVAVTGFVLYWFWEGLFRLVRPAPRSESSQKTPQD